MSGDPDRDRASHREPDEQRRARDEIERGTGVRHARVERVPRLDPVAHLGERQAGEPRRELGRQQLARRAPRAGHRLRRAAVDEDDGGRRGFVAQARLRAGRELDRPGHRLAHGLRRGAAGRRLCDRAGALAVARLVAVQAVAGEPARGAARPSLPIRRAGRGGSPRPRRAARR